MSGGTSGNACAPFLFRAAQAPSASGWSPPGGSHVRCQVVTLPLPSSTVIVRFVPVTLPPSVTVTGAAPPAAPPVLEPQPVTSADPIASPRARTAPARHVMAILSSLSGAARPGGRPVGHSGVTIPVGRAVAFRGSGQPREESWRYRRTLRRCPRPTARSGGGPKDVSP